MAVATRYFPQPSWTVPDGRWFRVVVCKCGARYNDGGTPMVPLCGQCGEQEYKDHERRIGRWVWGLMPARTWRRWFVHRPMVWEWKEKSWPEGTQRTSPSGSPSAGPP